MKTKRKDPLDRWLEANTGLFGPVDFEVGSEEIQVKVTAKPSESQWNKAMKELGFFHLVEGDK